MPHGDDSKLNVQPARYCVVIADRGSELPPPASSAGSVTVLTSSPMRVWRTAGGVPGVTHCNRRLAPGGASQLFHACRVKTTAARWFVRGRIFIEGVGRCSPATENMPSCRPPRFEIARDVSRGVKDQVVPAAAVFSSLMLYG